MASKSAAKLKVVDRQTKKMTKDQMRGELEKLVSNAKETMAYGIGIQVDQSTRFDSLLAIHDSFARFHGDGCELDVETATKVAEDMRDLLGKVAHVVDGITLDSVIEGEGNPIDGLIPETDASDWDYILVAAILFSAIRPWGEQLDSLRQQVMMRAHELGYIEEAEDGE